MEWEAVIGLEVHIQLATESKIFCGCSTKFGAAPNTQVCPVCMGLPGALPVLNKKAVQYAISLALATDSRINPYFLFARKNYFYPDLPKGYQISQFDLPFCEHGQVQFETPEGLCTVHIRRIHLEEDAGKSVHAEAYVAEDETLVDLNRCGVPLLELVTEPELTRPEHASAFLMHLRQLVRYLGISDGNMEEGSLRCDANVSLRPRGSNELGTKTELKNMNSFRHVERAIAFEIERQRELLNRGESVYQETLLWDAARQVAQPMRSKEYSHDYRYFPEPDLPPARVTLQEIDEIRRKLPEFPHAKKARYIEKLGLSPYVAAVLTEDLKTAQYFEAVYAQLQNAKLAANWVMGEVLRAVKETGTDIDQLKMTPHYLAGLLKMVENGTISATTAKQVFAETLTSGIDPVTVVTQRGLTQLTDENALLELMDKVLDEHAAEVAEYRAGKEKLFGFLLGQVMRAAGGRVDGKTVSRLLQKKLS